MLKVDFFVSGNEIILVIQVDTLLLQKSWRQKKPLIYGVQPPPKAFDSVTNGNNTIKADRANLSAAMGRQVGVFVGG